MDANVDGPMPSWASGRFGEDVAGLRLAIQMGLLDTESAMLESHLAGRSKHKFAAGAARMTNQYDRIAEHVLDLGIPGTELIKPGTFYELVLVHNTILCPYRVDSVDGFEPGDKWPKKLSLVMRELFALTDAPAPRWIADPLVEVEGLELLLRRSLADLAQRDPRPGLVLIPYEMNMSGLQRAWWGQANLLDDAGNLQWVTEKSLLTTGAESRIYAVPNQRAGDNFASGDLPEVALSTRSEAARATGTPPQSETEYEAFVNAAEDNEH
ncbi:hypothetical protein [Streptomyces sp. OR43]|uniref:hypothetical protein n=1 Tax=Streptomyces sp. or43 TaxID=2478957 RepID=UPI0011CE5524|nr:hypothetical protein [Streptomyces sp. or43]TXS37123.1 hypothetical protein EAO72_27605 [Streptomyces sp. or43]